MDTDGFPSGAISSMSRETELKQLIEDEPGNLAAITDLALHYLASGRSREAVAEFERAAEIAPHDPVVRYNLASMLVADGNAAAALRMLDAARRHNPDDQRLWYGTACALQVLGRQERALDAFQRSVDLDNYFANGWLGLASAHYALKHTGQAIECYARVLELDPDQATARHMYAALTGSTSDAPPEGFVRDLFDSYADHYEEHLRDQLGYRAPEVLGDLLKSRIAQRDDLDLLDLGCGTGLLGKYLQSDRIRLIGVDLSSAMLSRARDKDSYDRLVCADLVAYLESVPADSFDVITAVDVFNYLGHLDRVIEHGSRILRSPGLMAFTVEAAEDGGYQLAANGRYRHSRVYLDKLRQSAGLVEETLAVETIRTEGGENCNALVLLWSI